MQEAATGELQKVQMVLPVLSSKLFLQAPKEAHLVSTKDNEPQVIKFFRPSGKNLVVCSLFSGPWPHPLRVHGVVLIARSPVLEKLPQILTPGLNLSVFQRLKRGGQGRVGSSGPS